MTSTIHRNILKVIYTARQHTESSEQTFQLQQKDTSHFWDTTESGQQQVSRTKDLRLTKKNKKTQKKPHTKNKI